MEKAVGPDSPELAATYDDLAELFRRAGGAKAKVVAMQRMAQDIRSGQGCGARRRLAARLAGSVVAEALHDASHLDVVENRGFLDLDGLPVEARERFDLVGEAPARVDARRDGHRPWCARRHARRPSRAPTASSERSRAEGRVRRAADVAAAGHGDHVVEGRDRAPRQASAVAKAECVCTTAPASGGRRRCRDGSATRSRACAGRPRRRRPSSWHEVLRRRAPRRAGRRA